MPHETSESRKRELQVLELRRAGLTFDVIAERTGYANRASCRRAYERALARVSETVDANDVRQLELDRMDRLQAGLWPRAARGELPAVDRILKISERRDRLSGQPTKNAHALREALDASVAANGFLDPGVDGSLIASAQALADRIDAAIAYGDAAEVHKAMGLVPHLTATLREMQATPAARAALKQAAEEAKAEEFGAGSALGRLRGIKGGRSA